MMVTRLLSALPATATNVASALALNSDIGEAVSVGSSTGKTIDART
jgi:hypothetical protein